MLPALARLFMRRGLLVADALAMAQWEHGGGFSVDASVRIEAADHAGRERRLTPLALLDRLAAQVPPPRIHRHRSSAC